MGRKSNAKKAVREMLDEKEDQAKNKKSKHKSKKQRKKQIKEQLKKSQAPSKSAKKEKKTKKAPKKEAKKETKIKTPSKLNKGKIFGAGLSIIMITALAAVGYLLFERAFRAQPIAKILPAANTIALVELNTNFEHHQLTKAFNLLKDHPTFSEQKLIESLEAKTGLTFKSDIEPWLGRQGGLAFLLPSNTDHQEQLHSVYFAEILNQQNFQKFLKKNIDSSSEYKGAKIYKLGNYQLTELQDYLAFTDSEEAMKALVEAQTPSTAKLYDYEQYRRLDDNMPLIKTAYIYLNFSNISTSFLQKFPLLTEKGLSLDKIQPIIPMLETEGMALIAEDDNFVIQSFLSLNHELAKDSQYLSYQHKYDATLTEFVRSDVLAFWGATNLEHQIKRLLEVLSGGDRATLTVFDALVNSYTQKYFGSDINFNRDILPLFNDEFAFAIEKPSDNSKNNQAIYKLLLELNSPEKDAIKIQELASSFALVGAVFEPKVVERELEDGTIAREIVAIPEEIGKEELEYLDTTIYQLKIGQQDWGIYYSIIDNTAIIASDIAGIKSSINIVKDKGSNLRNTNYYSHNIDPLITHSDEISYFNLAELLPLIFTEEELAKLPELLTILDSFSSGRNYFTDGLVTINYIHLK
jgi:hypothetical protein